MYDAPMAEGLDPQEDHVDSRGAAAGFGSSFLVLFGLWSFAVAQPLFDVLGDGAVFFLAHGTGGVDIVVFALVVAAFVPLVLTLIVALAGGIAAVAERAAAGFLHALLASLLVAERLREWTGPPWAVLGISLVLGVCLARVLAGWSRARQLVGWIGAASVVFPLVFLFHSPARTIWLDRETSTGKIADQARSAIPVVMVVFDELPLVALLNADEEIDEGRFPSFASLAQTSTWFRNATSVALSTDYAVPSMLSGRYPAEQTTLRPTQSSYPENLFTLVGSEFPVHATEWVTSLCPRSICAPGTATGGVSSRQFSLLADAAAVYLHRVTPGAWREALPAIDGKWSDFWPKGEDRAQERAVVPTRFAAFLDILRDSPGPALYYMHSKQPHTPWDRIPSGKRYRDWSLASHGLRGGRWQGSEWQRLQAQRRLLLMVGFVDGLLGRLRERLEELGLWDAALLVVTSDHGCALTKGSGRRMLSPGTDSLVEIANVPLFIKWPEQTAGRVDDSNVEIIDVLPTVLDTLGLPIPENIEGVSLARDRRRAKPKRISLTQFKGKGTDRIHPFEPEALEARKRIVEEMIERFGSGDWDSVYHMGLHAELFRRSVRDLLEEATGPAAGPTVSIRDHRLFDDVDPEALYLPIHVKGEVHAPATGRTRRLAIAVDGRVYGTTETWLAAGRTRFTSLLPEDALSPGPNHVEVYEILESDGSPTLRGLRFRGE